MLDLPVTMKDGSSIVVRRVAEALPMLKIDSDQVRMRHQRAAGSGMLPCSIVHLLRHLMALDMRPRRAGGLRIDGGSGPGRMAHDMSLRKERAKPMNVMTVKPTAELETKTGYRFVVRPAEESDDGDLTAFFEEHVTKDDLRFRFLSPIQHVTPKQIEAMTHIDHRQTEDFLAFAPGSDEIIASAILAADKTMQTAEVAFTVHADLKGKGIESRLLEYVTAQARARGIKKLQAIESRENICAITLERELGFKSKGIDGEPMLMLLEAAL